MNTNEHSHKCVLLVGPVVPEPCDSLDTESDEGSVAGGRAGGGSASDFSDRFSLRVLRTTVMSSWLRISCWKQDRIFTTNKTAHRETAGNIVRQKKFNETQLE